MEQQQIEKAVKFIKKSVNRVWWIYFVMVAMCLFLAALNLWDFAAPFTTLKITLTSIYYLYLMAAIPLSFYFFHKKTQQWAVIDDLKTKLEKYRNGALSRILWIQLAGFLGVMLNFCFHDPSFVFCIGISLVALIFCRTGEKQIYNDLKIKDLV